MLMMHYGHIYLATVLRNIRRYPWSSLTRDDPRVHGLHDYNHPGEQRVRGSRVDEVQYIVPQAHGAKGETRWSVINTTIYARCFT